MGYAVPGDEDVYLSEGEYGELTMKDENEALSAWFGSPGTVSHHLSSCM